MPREHFFTDRESLFKALLEECVSSLNLSIKKFGQATLLVSGGSSPKPLYQQLSQQVLEWSKVNVALVDERWVDFDNAASNEQFIHKNLLQGPASKAHFIAMKNQCSSAEHGQPSCERQYQQMLQPFDFTILGMGSDGHTASLFPAAQGLAEALDVNHSALCAAITANASEVTGEFTERMTLTLSGLMQSRKIVLLITGDEKLAVYKNALASNDALLFPVSAVLNQSKIPVDVYWAP
jgi:6-phosphogluconolactonase